ncbi:MAG: phosphatidylserine decarboxylase family protein [Saprospiraceae bacterium]|nr:phosphatidylserine decarboxylase family protein [Candidatus Defluviibacterium haderslevense]MBK7244555.1 phosphatidylserine decarboxylase family protein [Candidatus Defluviibacterium haderslevense]
MIHKEGYSWILISLIAYIVIVIGLNYTGTWLVWPISIILGILFLIIVNFFRNPNRKIIEIDDQKIIAPADGKVVVIEKTFEPEYFKDERIQVSIFMNPLNVHVNRYPISGVVSYSQYHKGKYLVAWHPKASTENERTTVVIKRKDGTEILMRQIAGALAKRICCYSKAGDTATQGDDMGFIKFGSRVDLYLPLGTNISVSLEQKVQGNINVIGTLNN